LATGILRNPKVPEEFQNFKGPMFHTAQWDNTCPLEGKIVAVVGVGASGIQVLPEVAKKAKKLIVYQR
jgi:cation diffusion facilitator CzcD-associated flavoprotein CzcO